MRKQDIRAMIEHELAKHPNMTSFELADTCRLPLHIVEIFRAKITRNHQPSLTDKSNE